MLGHPAVRRSLDLLLQVAVLGLLVGPSPDDLGAASSANQIAAMPSLHVGWALLVAIACVAGLRSRWRWVAVAHPVLTTSVVVVTANHHWTDGRWRRRSWAPAGPWHPGSPSPAPSAVGGWLRRVAPPATPRHEEARPMTDLNPELDPTATCLNCGARVDVPLEAAGAVTCWSCGAAVEAGARDHTRSDLTDEELVRSFGAKGYDTEVSLVAPASLRCGGCGSTTEAASWGVDDVRTGSEMATPGTTESAVAAVRCPVCERPGVVELALRGPDVATDDRVHDALVAGRGDRLGGP